MLGLTIFVSPVTQLLAAQSNATNRPLGEIERNKEAAFAISPAEFVETRVAVI
jgi:hypothetical protein